jgi:hypothetical protein
LPGGTDQHRGGDGEQNAADDRARDAVAGEQRDALAEQRPEQQHQTRGKQREQGIEADQIVGNRHAGPVPIIHPSYFLSAITRLSIGQDAAVRRAWGADRRRARR